MHQVSKAHVEETTNEPVVDQQLSPHIAQIEQPPKVSNAFRFALFNVRDEIVDTTTLVGQHNNEQPSFILDLITQQLVAPHSTTQQVQNKSDTQLQQVDVAQVTQWNKEKTQTMCPMLLKDLNLIRHLLVKYIDDVNVTFA